MIHLLEIVDEIGDVEEAGASVAHMLFYFFPPNIVKLRHRYRWEMLLSSQSPNRKNPASGLTLFPRMISSTFDASYIQSWMMYMCGSSHPGVMYDTSPEQDDCGGLCKALQHCAGDSGQRRCRQPLLCLPLSLLQQPNDLPCIWCNVHVLLSSHAPKDEVRTGI